MYSIDVPRCGKDGKDMYSIASEQYCIEQYSLCKVRRGNAFVRYFTAQYRPSI